MRMYDIIEKKRNGEELSDAEIDFFVTGYVAGNVADYQASALCMAIFYEGMSARETARLTLDMAHSGDLIDLSGIHGIKVDKHSTGGVGDKTTLVLGPIVASLGVPVAKMSGRGLGHTGGTLDKLEAIPGLSVNISGQDFFTIVNEVGVAVVGQTGNLVPADKKLYALRDVTATVDSLPLIASSIMSKKIAAGADKILLDVKCGSGAFMKTPADAIALAEAMVAIGEHVGRETVALITDMARPLGDAIGNALEVIEAIETLKGHAPADITDTCVELAANMLYLAEKGSLEECRAMARAQIANGQALEKLREMIAAQGGNPACVDDYSLFAKARLSRKIRAEHAGYITAMDTERIGIASVALGAGRATKDDAVDPAAGIVLAAKTGTKLVADDVMATLYAEDEAKLDEAEEIFRNALSFGDASPEQLPHFFARVTKDGVERFC